jgi:hypothetical protein
MRFNFDLKYFWMSRKGRRDNWIISSVWGPCQTVVLHRMLFWPRWNNKGFQAQKWLGEWKHNFNLIFQMTELGGGGFNNHDFYSDGSCFKYITRNRPRLMFPWFSFVFIYRYLNSTLNYAMNNSTVYNSLLIKHVISRYIIWTVESVVEFMMIMMMIIQSIFF